MQPTKELIRELDREKIEWARQMTPGERLLAGPQLFDRSMQFVEAGVRMQNPGADEERIEELIDERLRIMREVEDRPIPSIRGSFDDE